MAPRALKLPGHLLPCAQMKRLLCLLLVTSVISPQVFAAEEAAEKTPRVIKADEVLNFTLLDQRGRPCELKRADAKVVVLFVGGNGCPIVRQSISKLRALRSKFAEKGVVFWMLNANSQDTREEIAAEADAYRVGSIPVLKDDLQLVAHALAITRTAEAIAINTTDWTILYRGAIDDQLTEGAKKPEPTATYLADALNEFFAGKPVSTAKTSVRGCLIEFDTAPKDDPAPVSYAKEIAPLLRAKCVSCHSPGNIGPFAMSNYKKVKG